MKLLDSIGLLLLSVLLITWSTLSLFELQVANLATIIATLTLVTGIMLLFRLTDEKAYINVGMLLLSAWLMLSGVLPLLNTDFPGSILVLALVATAAGLFFLPVIIRDRSFYNLGLFLLGVWLILSNGYHIWGIQFPAINVALALLGSLAALLLLLGV